MHVRVLIGNRGVSARVCAGFDIMIVPYVAEDANGGGYDGIFKEKRYRLPDSEVSASRLQECLKKWFATCGHRRIDLLLDTVAKEWPSRGTPLPKLLVQKEPLAFVEILSEADPWIHPRHTRLVVAILAEHGRGHVFEPKRSVELDTMLQSRLILAMLRKYRDLAKYSDKYSCVIRRASSEERRVLERLIQKIQLPPGDVQVPANLAQEAQFRMGLTPAAFRQPAVQQPSGRQPAIRQPSVQPAFQNGMGEMDSMLAEFENELGFGSSAEGKQHCITPCIVFFCFFLFFSFLFCWLFVYIYRHHTRKKQETNKTNNRGVKQQTK